MAAIILFSKRCPTVGIAVNTAVEAGVIGADIDALNAAAALPLILIGGQQELCAADFLNPGTVNACLLYTSRCV